MGEVYRGLDTRLNRPVAIKKSGEQFSDRFNTEARAIAALNHPHVCTLYDVGPDYLVMELIEGDTLADRLLNGPLPLADVLRLGAQIASALAAAHAKGIVHRDLKPGNIMLTRAGVKVLDFGIAKMSGVGAETVTVTGGIVGTPAYLSPEQLAGAAADSRSDIYALGLVLAEMATGKRLGPGVDPTAALASLPERVAHVIDRCLARDADTRWQSAADVGRELEWAARSASTVAPAAASGRYRTTILAVMAAVAVTLAGARSLRFFSPPTESTAAPAMATSISLPAGLRLDSLAPLAVSPDGTHLAFVAINDLGDRTLYLRPLASTTVTELKGTTGAMHPFFSPDGRSIGFFTGDALHRVGIDGSAPLRVCPLPGVDHGGAWGGDDIIVVAIRARGLFTVNAGGGTLEPMSSARAAWPSFLPDGKTILYTGSRPDSGRTVSVSVVSLEGTTDHEIARLSDEEGSGAPVLGAAAEIQQAMLLPQGQLVFGQDPGFVRALPIDPQTLVPRGTSRTLGEMVERGGGAGGIAFAVSRSGLLVFAPTGNDHQLVWATRQGVITPLNVNRAAYRGPRLSPDERTIAVSANTETRRPDIWVIDVDRGTRTRIATEALDPVWTPDGSRVTHSGGGDSLGISSTDGRNYEPLATFAEASQFIRPGTAPFPTGWSPEGRHLLFQASTADVWRLTFPERTFEPVLTGPANEWGAVISPDGKSIAFVSDESGRAEVYLARWPGLEQRTAVSTRGGQSPRWSKDSTEVFFWQRRTMMAARVEPSLRVEIPRPLFSGDFFGAARNATFDVAANGRFLLVQSDERARLTEITVLQNWMGARQ